jgi:acyl-CoA synthetase (AMP-forming)/AMP-acid ligase II
MLNGLLRRAVSRNPAKAALVQGDRRMDYRELEIGTARLAGAIMDLGIRPGDAVAVMLPNGPEFVIALFALARVRAIMLPCIRARPWRSCAAFWASGLRGCS